MLKLYELTEQEEKIAKKILKTVCKIHGIKPRHISADITMVDKEEIRNLNSSTRNIDKATDVLSFPAEDCIVFPFDIKNYKEVLSPEDKTLYIGEIIVCRDIMNEQAVEYGHSTERECAFLITHGFLHLLGYDHIEEDERAVMRAKEDEVLNTAKFLRE